MRRTLTNDEFAQQLRDYTSTAYRFELQSFYTVDGEQESFQRFLEGRPISPYDVDEDRAWLDMVKAHTAAGKRMARVRVHEDPPTDYQRWMRYRGDFNITAGEAIHYLTVDQATQAGILAGVALRDWWFFDNNRLMVLTHNPEGRRIHTELITDEPELKRARAMWDLAVHTTRGENR
uniref:DUF6879 family protein n=1 Tax=Paractinoplanes polyasparticus TaxID=2856853 RepID=UPI001C85F34D|nr:DUF6879 family protein [Actinoplanes polyasparticus]